MNLYLIKVLAIFLVTVCCIIATYTDVKYQIIPNRLTIPLLIIGTFLVSFFYFQIGEFNYYYYISVVIVFVISYIPWYFGVWAGGDVKIFTAISTLFIPEFLDIIPEYTFFNVHLPYNLLSFSIPTLVLMLNSIFSIIPLIILIVLFNIIKDKCYLIDELKKTFNFKEVILSLNSLISAYIIISLMDVHYTIIKIILLITLSYFITKMMKNDTVLKILTITIICHQFFTGNILIYLEELLLISLLYFVIKLYASGIIKESLTDNFEKIKVEEGMILAYPLCKVENKYYFEKTSLKSLLENKIHENNKKEIISNNQAKGLTCDEIALINQIDEIDLVPIKKGLPFAPFILSGLCLTFLIGNTFDLLKILWGMV